MIIDGKDIKNISQTRIYGIYYGMISRCHNPNNPRYNSYGLKGIFVCDEWREKKKGFIAFYKWSMKNGYKEDLTIDRIDNDKGYSPDNCRWATWEQQANNKTNTVKFFTSDKGKTYCIKDLIKIGNSAGIVINRLMMEKFNIKVGDKLEVTNCKKNQITFKKVKEEE